MNKTRLSVSLLVTVFILGIYISPIQAQNQLDQIGTFEGNLPAFWNVGNQPSGSTLTWATDQFVSMGHSLKIDKSATSDSAAFVSSNMCDIWSPSIPANVDILFGAWIKTENVNTNPSSDDQKWYIAYSFYDTTGALIGTTKLPIDQTVATSSGWVGDTTAVGQVSLPVDAYKMIISFVGGANATGTVWADNFIFTGRNGNWAGQDWNTGVGAPTGYYYWLPPIGGNDGVLNSGFENTVVTTEAAHSGTHSLKFDMPAGRQAHDGFVGSIRMPFSQIDPSIKPGDVVRIAVWVQANSLEPDSAAKYPGTWSVGLTPLFFSTTGNNDGYNPFGSNDYTFTFPNATSFNWTQFYVDVKVPTDTSTHALEVRLHVYSTFTGVVYFDDLTVTKLEVPALSDVGSFEQTTPSYWTVGNQPSGSSVTWATDQFVSMGHSLKIDKSATSDSASWVSTNMCDIWSPSIPANVDILFGAWIKTENVNTNPSSDDQKWYVAYSFYDTTGALIGTTKLPIDQTVATSSGWVGDTTAVGQVSLPVTAYKMIISFVGGANATGTVWADNFIFTGRNGNWAGQDWNTSVGVPEGWYYWFPPIGGNDGVLSNGFENTVVTTEAAHSGTHSLEFNMPAAREVHDGFVGSKRYLLDGSDFVMSKVSKTSGQMDIAHLSNVLPGDSIRISVWIKADSLVPDSAAKYPGTWSVGITPLYFSGTGNNYGYNPFGANDYTFTFPSVTSFDWTQFNLDVQVPTDTTTKAMEARLHVYSQFVGKVYFDDLTIQKISGLTAVNGMNGLVPATFMLYQNYPNPFNPSTRISYFLPNATNVKVLIYDILGREVKSLVNDYQASGTHNVVWNGDNNFGGKVASGVYIYRVVAGNNIATKKMVLLK